MTATSRKKTLEPRQAVLGPAQGAFVEVEVVKQLTDLEIQRRKIGGVRKTGGAPAKEERFTATRYLISVSGAIDTNFIGTFLAMFRAILEVAGIMFVWRANRPAACDRTVPGGRVQKGET